MAGKWFLQNDSCRLCRYSVDQKFCRNHSISLRFQDKWDFQHRNSWWLRKVAGKRFFGKVGGRLFSCPVGHKLRWNHSISLHFWNKQAEIQDGHQKWWENDFCKKSLVESTDTLWVKNFVEINLSRGKCIFVFNAEIQDGHQKWRENIFWENFTSRVSG